MMCRILLLLFTVSGSSTDDLLDSVKSNVQLINDLKDVYHAYHVNHIIEEQKENINLSLEFNDGADLKDVLVKNISECERVKNTPITNTDVKLHLNDYIARTTQNYRVLMDKGASSGEFKKDYNDYKTERKNYYNFLQNRFSLEKFIKLSEDQYWHNIDKKTYRQAKLYGDYEKAKSGSLTDAMKILSALVSQTSDFQEQSIYQIELADNYVKRYRELDHDTVSSFDIAITMYRTVIDQSKYSLYLYESWVKWRSVLQKTKGASKTSEIPNNDYDNVREKVARTILDYVSKNDHDEMAINQFFVIATHGIVNRFGQYEYGNQNAIEFNELFEEKK